MMFDKLFVFNWFSLQQLEQKPFGITCSIGKIKNVHFPLDWCVKVEKKMIWHYVFRRVLEDLNAPALHWLWFGAQECTALEGEGR